MSIITPSMAAFISSRFRSLGTTHVEPDLLAEIPSEMLAQLQRQGVLIAALLPLTSLGAYAAICAVWNLINFDPDMLDAKRLVIFLLVQIGVSVVFFRLTVRAALNRELHFRALNGKWRWER